MKRLIRAAYMLGAVLFSLPAGASAQNSGGVFGPVVQEGHRMAEYRIAHALEEEGRTAITAQRLHFEQSQGDAVMWRVAGQMLTRKGEDRFDYLQGEVFWELTPPQRRYRLGMRFDARIRGDGVGGAARPEQININLTQEFAFTAQLVGRFVVLTKKQIGAAAAEGVLIETRARLAYDLPAGPRLALESYNGHGGTRRFGRYAEEVQQIGPAAEWRLAENWRLVGRTLFGMGGAAPDLDVTFWVGRRF